MFRIAFPTLLILLPGLAAAHTGEHAGGFLSGAAHPLGGADHVLAMLAVGLWAAQAGGRALWAAPSVFLFAMLAGAGLGFAGIPFPAVEPVILASAIVLGAAVALALRPPLPMALAAVAVFGLAHGHAHGAEGPAAGLALYAAGFAVATAALHAAGILLGVALSRGVRVVGGLTAAAGVALAFAG